MFKTAYHKNLIGKKVVTLYHDNSDWYLVSQYTGAIEPVSVRGLISHLRDFKR